MDVFYDEVIFQVLIFLWWSRLRLDSTFLYYIVTFETFLEYYLAYSLQYKTVVSYRYNIIINNHIVDD